MLLLGSSRRIEWSCKKGKQRDLSSSSSSVFLPSERVILQVKVKGKVVPVLN
jgi:hypothetical protein